MTNDRIVTGVKTLSGKDPWAQGQSFRTVEQLQAQIASLTAENERLREALREVSTYFHGAIKHNILNALQPKEGEGWATT